MDLADSRQESARDRWVQQQMEEAMKHLATDLEVLPSPLLLEQMEREAVQRCSPPAPLAAHSDPAVKPLPSSRRKKPKFPRLAAAPPMPSSLAPARCSEATPDELEQRLRFYARQIKSFRTTSLLYSSPELMERIKQMEEDYETAVRQFYCRPPSPTLSHMSAAAVQHTPGLQGAATEQPTPGLQRAAAAQPTSGLQRTAAAQPTSGLQRAAAEQPTSGLQSAAAEQPTSGLQSAGAEQPTPGLQSAATEQSTSGLQSAAAEQPTSGLQPDTPQPDTPQPGMKPDHKSASTFSTRRRGRRKRVASAEVTEGLSDASASVNTTEGLGDASASANATEGLGDASAPAHVTEGPGDASAPAHVTEGPGDASAPAPSLQAFQGFSEGLVLVLVPEPCDEGFEEEAPPDPVSEGFKEQFVLVLASEPRDEGSPGTASASEGSGAASVSEGLPGAASFSEGSPGRLGLYVSAGLQVLAAVAG
ncbi:hypothetical protein CRENBAI_001361 [Crenichthys baileyi]|uniref:Uncharacterized protein n=1 Tax=Crenichthys baileyi TaxID=28760 RepID=A0AAV9QT27_9TELE